MTGRRRSSLRITPPNRPAILVFARAPVPGKVKTRLLSALGAEGAAALHRRLSRHAIATALAAELGEVILYCAPDTRHPFFRRVKKEFGVSLRRQKGADLGERMHHALSFALARFPAAILIGSDCADIDPAYLRQAAARLETDAASVVLGPAADGGYVLIAARRSDMKVFSDVPWGTSGVLAATRARLNDLGWRFSELRTLADVDRPEDLARLPPELRL